MRYSSRNLSPQAWLLIPLALLVGGLILFFGQTDDNASVRVVQSSSSGMVLSIGPGEGGPPGTAGAKARRAQALANLAEFRAHYQQLSPFVSVIAIDDSAAGGAFARELGDLLAELNLGNRVKQPPAATGGEDSAAIRLRCAPGDGSVARDLVAALSPLLRGSATITFDQSLGVADMLLAVSDEARASGP